MYKPMELNQVVLVWLIVANIVTLALYGIDKYKSIRHMWRIQEKTLLLWAVAGGSIGALLGMQLFRHKTQHLKFKYGVPFILLVQLAAWRLLWD